jgi:RND family efflux transporter MFP subunit
MLNQSHAQGPPRRARARRFFAAALAAPLALALAACAREPQGPPAASGEPGAAAPREVKVAAASRETWARTLRVTGELEPAETATLTSPLSGRLTELAVDVGTRVTRGQVIARLDRRDFELEAARALANARVARAALGLAPEADAAAFDPEQSPVVREARVVLEQAGREHGRQVQLLQGGATTQSALDASASELAAAESRLAAARETLATRRATLVQREAEFAIAQQAVSDTEIASPFDGVVAQRLAGTGDYLAPGSPIARLLCDDPLRLVLSLPEQHSAAVAPGMEIRARPDSGAPPILTHVARVAPALTAADRALLVEADVPNPGGVLRAGSFVRAELVLDAAALTLSIPPAALVRFAGVEKVFVAKDGLAAERRVRIGRIEELRLEVLEGLEPGELVVLDPGRLQGGARLSILE